MSSDNQIKVLVATSQSGRAEGLEAAAKILLELVDHSTRVVGTNTLRDLTQQFNEVAADLRKQSSEALRPFNQ